MKSLITKKAIFISMNLLVLLWKCNLLNQLFSVKLRALEMMDCQDKCCIHWCVVGLHRWRCFQTEPFIKTAWLSQIKPLFKYCLSPVSFEWNIYIDTKVFNCTLIYNFTALYFTQRILRQWNFYSTFIGAIIQFLLES